MAKHPMAHAILERARTEGVDIVEGTKIHALVSTVDFHIFPRIWLAVAVGYIDLSLPVILVSLRLGEINARHRLGRSTS